MKKINANRINMPSVRILAVAVVAMATVFVLSGFMPLTGSVSILSIGKFCSADFKIQSSGTGICTFKAYVKAQNCGTPSLTIRQDSCSGNFICDNDVYFDSTNSKCTWAVRSGAYTYALCDGTMLLAEKSITC